jgi:hypothetical protein
MHEDGATALRAAGLAVEGEDLSVEILLDEDGEVLSVTEDVPVFDGKTRFVALPALSELLSGDARPPSFADGPTPEYVPFFLAIEWTAARFCVTTEHWITDQEFERLYDKLRRRPDGDDDEVLFSYLQAAVRLYAAQHRVSAPEFEAVLRRLARSARIWSEGPVSREYVEGALVPLVLGE